MAPPGSPRLRVALASLLAVAALVAGERHAVRPHAAAAAARRGGRRRVAATAAAALVVAATAQEPESSPMVLMPFADIDTDGDGKVSREEYRGFAKKRIDDQNLEDPEVVQRLTDFFERLFDEADIDGDGSLCDRELEYGELLKNHAASIRLTAPDADDDDVDEFTLEHRKSMLLKHDTNGDGLIDKHEWTKAMRETAVKVWGWESFLDDPEVADWLDHIWARADVNGDGTMTEKEVFYTALLGQHLHGHNFQDRLFAEQLMRSLDKNKDGKVDEEEVTQGAAEEEEEEMGGEGPRFIQRVKVLFEESDEDGDKALDGAEMRKITRRIMDEL